MSTEIEYWHMVEAIEEGNIEWVKSRLEQGIDPNIKEYGMTPLHWACEHQDLDIVELLLDFGADPNVIDGHTDRTTLMFWLNSEDMLELLVRRGVDINASSHRGETALSLAAGDGNMTAVKWLLEHGASMDDGPGGAALLAAYMRGHSEIVEYLFGRGINVNARDFGGRTVLMAACSEGDLKTVELLLARGADIGILDSHGMTALLHACASGHMDLVKFLADLGADTDASGPGGCQALCDAMREANRHAEFGSAKQVQASTIEFLFEHGLEINRRDKTGTSPLSLASFFVDVDMVKLLISRGADLNVRDGKGYSALMIACLWASYRSRSLHGPQGDFEIIKMILDEGCETESEDPESGDTALIYASIAARLDIVRLLLDYGADVNARSFDGMSALRHIICRCQFMEARFGHTYGDVAELLLARGADPNFRLDDGETDLEIAQRKGYTEMVELLLKYGAKP
jgi:ankyrin repeat protein